MDSKCINAMTVLGWKFDTSKLRVGSSYIFTDGNSIRYGKYLGNGEVKIMNLLAMIKEFGKISGYIEIPPIVMNA